MVMCNTDRGGASSSSSRTATRWEKGTHGEMGEGCCQEARRYEGYAYKQLGAATQARHSTGEGAEGGGGVLTWAPIDVTDAGMAMLVMRLF